MKSRLGQFAGVICLSVAICAQGLAQSPAPGVPNIGELQKSAMKLAVGGAVASAAVGVIALVAHHRHKSQSGKEKASKGTPVARGQSSPDVLKSGQLNGTGETNPVQISQSFPSQ
jgi:hypothetical protein